MIISKTNPLGHRASAVLLQLEDTYLTANSAAVPRASQDIEAESRDKHPNVRRLKSAWANQEALRFRQRPHLVRYDGAS
jgi:hypothetical protein